MKTHAFLAGWLMVVATVVTAQPVDVKVQTQGERVIVDVTAKVAAKRDIVWGVLTDYDRMAEFVTNLKSSRVLSRKGDQLVVAQAGEAKRAFLHFSFATTRSVDLTPSTEIRSHLVRGDFKSYEFTTRLTGDATGATTIVHHGEYVPNAWVPPVVGPAMIETETRKQYAELIAEMLRREATR